MNTNIFRDVVKLPDVENGVLSKYVAISDENNKLGKVCNVSFLPGSGFVFRNDGVALVNVRGTCGGVCTGCDASKTGGRCYARASMFVSREASRAWAINTLIMRRYPLAFFFAISDYIHKKRKTPEYFRINVSGEITPAMLDVWVMLAEYFNGTAPNRPRVIFYGYTKRTDVIHARILDRGPLPDNLVFMASIWRDTVSNPDNLPTFEYDDGAQGLENVTHCPAINASGKATGVKCEQCMYCAHARPGDRMAVYAH